MKIIYEDQDVLVLDKPAGLLVYPTHLQEKGTLVDWLLEEYPEIKTVGDAVLDPRVKPEDDKMVKPEDDKMVKPEDDKASQLEGDKGGKRGLFRPGIVHRLDKDTSGLMAVAKNQKAYIYLKEQFQRRKVVKKYLALVYGRVKSQKGVIIRSIGRTKRDFRKKAVSDFLTGKRARTKYQVLGYYVYCRDRLQSVSTDRNSSEQTLTGSSSELFTLLDVQIETGRTHQIRVHLTGFGHPIVGDPLYKFKRQKQLPGLKRQFLHAYYLKFMLLSGEVKEFKIDLADDLKRLFGT